MGSRRRPTFPGRRAVQLIGVGVAVGLYYASQWLTEVVSIADALPVGSGLATLPWVVAIDHHAVQLAFAVGCIWYLGRGEWASWGLNAGNVEESRRLLTRGPFPVLVAFLFLGELLVPVLSRTPPAFDYELTALNVVGTLAFVGVVSGLSEEVLFRGLIQTYLAAYFEPVYPVLGRGLPLAGIVAALIFTVVHVGFTVLPLGVYHLHPPQLVLAFVLGLYYAVAYHETGSLLAPIVAHNVVNGTIVTTTFLAAWILAW